MFGVNNRVRRPQGGCKSEPTKKCWTEMEQSCEMVKRLCFLPDLMRNKIFLRVNKALTGASAVPNSEDTSRVQICANSGENAEALSLKLLLTMALPITKIHLKRVINYSKKSFDQI